MITGTGRVRTEDIKVGFLRKVAAMKDLVEEMARRFYDIHERHIFQRTNFAKTSLLANQWKDLKERDRREYIDSFRELLSDPEILQIVRNRAEL